MTQSRHSSEGGTIIALSGGVGGAKLALGLSRCLSADALTIVANTADDFEHLGLAISPDLDTVMYTLAGLNDRQRGWGLADESFHMMESLARLGGESWFQLGDRDLATHLQRSQMLRHGATLTQVTAALCKQLDVQHRLLPMSDDPVRTLVLTDQGELPFQHYFVREQCNPRIVDYRFDGIDAATAQSDFMQLLCGNDVRAVIICPSNPFVSVSPILQLPGVRAAMKKNAAPVIAISPIVGGAAIKGPAAKMMDELGLSVSADSVAAFYGDLLDGFVLDRLDQHLLEAVRSMGIAAVCEDTIMKSTADRIGLAEKVLRFVDQWERS